MADSSRGQSGDGAPAGEEAQELAAGEVLEITGAELGMAVAREVMDWQLDHEQYVDTWVDSRGKLTGYYYGHPFSPYRDRNALGEVWRRIDALNLRETYLDTLQRLVSQRSGTDQPMDAWALLTCDPTTACHAAILTVRQARNHA